jgi:hypothetical protein
VRGLSFDAVFVPGLAERMFPRKIVEEPILLDALRIQIGGGLTKEIAAFENKFARLWLVEIIAHSSEERLDGKWFRKIGFASALPDFFLVLLHGKTGNGDHRNMAQMFVLLDPLRDLKSGNVGQLNIHHYEIGFVQAREFQRFDAAAARQRLIAMRFQKIVEQLHVQLIVFHDQNAFLHRKNAAPRGGRSCGRFRKRKCSKGGDRPGPMGPPDCFRLDVAAALFSPLFLLSRSRNLRLPLYRLLGFTVAPNLTFRPRNSPLRRLAECEHRITRSRLFQFKVGR